MKTLGLGNALVDALLMLTSDDALTQIGIEKGVMDLIDRDKMLAIQDAQKELDGDMAPGGSACNMIRSMAMLGASTGFIGKIGDDAIGFYYEEELERAHVSSYFIKVPGETGISTVLISPDGQRTMCTYLGPAATLTADELDEKIFAGYHYLYIEGYLIVNESLLRRALVYGKKYGLKVALDLSSFNVVEDNLPMLREVIPQYVDILFCNEQEALVYTGLPAREAVEAISKQIEISIVTIGKEGAYIGRAGEIVHVKAEGGIPIDTTGAGDNFAAGCLYGLSEGASLKQSASIGSLLAGYAIDVIGAKIPDEHWEQIKLKVKEILASNC